MIIKNVDFDFDFDYVFLNYGVDALIEYGLMPVRNRFVCFGMGRYDSDPLVRQTMVRMDIRHSFKLVYSDSHLPSR